MNRDATKINDQRSTETTVAVCGVSAGERSDDGGNLTASARGGLELATGSGPEPELLVCRVSRELWLTLLARMLLLVDMALRMAT